MMNFGIIPVAMLVLIPGGWVLFQLLNDTECQWWLPEKNGCPCAKGSKLWDGKEHYTKRENTLKEE